MKRKKFEMGRASHNCLACSSPSLKRHWTIVSSFFALRAFHAPAGPITELTCSNCGTRYFDIKISDSELANFYAGYRDQTYVQQRAQFEPRYTIEFNASLGGEDEMTIRRKVMMEFLGEQQVLNSIDAVLDHGGDRGQMLRDLTCSKKAVFDVSAVEPEPGLEAVSKSDIFEREWDLILSCHVLEHLIDPRAYVNELEALGKPGTYYFIEVPYEPSKNNPFNGTILQRFWLSLISRQLWVLTWLDRISMRLLSETGHILPLMFFALREHLSFFTTKGVIALLRERNLNVLSSRRASTGHIIILAQKRAF